MFINLVRIGLLKLTKNRTFRAGIIGIPALFFLVIISFNILLVWTRIYLDYGDTFTGGGITEWQQKGFIVALYITSVFLLLDVIIVICDYYEYRQVINIEGAIRSRVKLCLSEIAAVFIFSFIAAFYTMVLSFAGVIRDGVENFILCVYPVVTLKTYIASALTMFDTALPAVFLSKLIRKKLPVVVLYISYHFLASILIVALSTIAEYGTAGSSVSLESTLTLDLVYMIFHPTSLLLSHAMGDSSVIIGLPQVLACYLINVIFWVSLSMIASRRKVVL